MKDLVNEKVAKYIAERKKLSNITIPHLSKYKFSNVIAIQIWKNVTMTRKQIIMRSVGLLMNEKIMLHEDDDCCNENTVLKYREPVPVRRDNELIFENASAFLKPYNYVSIDLTSKLNLKLLIKKLPIFFEAFKVLSNYDLVSRIYYASSAAMLYEIDSKISKSEALNQTKLMITFQDHEMVQNAIVQYVQSYGGRCVTMQHGQRVFRRLDADFMAFDNFIADYTLLWNRFSQEQYVKAGYDPMRLPVVGCSKYAVHEDVEEENINFYKDGETIVIGVVLNTPAQFGAEEVTEKILGWCSELIATFGNKYRVLIKCHPTDDVQKYSKYIQKDKMEFVDIKMSMKAFSSEISLGLGHASGAIIDMIIMGKPVIQYLNNIAFPLDLPDEYTFTNYEELVSVLKSVEDSLSKDIGEFKKLRERYYESNPYEKHLRFFESLRKELYANKG